MELMISKFVIHTPIVQSLKETVGFGIFQARTEETSRSLDETQDKRLSPIDGALTKN